MGRNAVGPTPVRRKFGNRSDFGLQLLSDGLSPTAGRGCDNHCQIVYRQRADAFVLAIRLYSDGISSAYRRYSARFPTVFRRFTHSSLPRSQSHPFYLQKCQRNKQNVTIYITNVHTFAEYRLSNESIFIYHDFELATLLILGTSSKGSQTLPMRKKLTSFLKLQAGKVGKQFTQKLMAG